MQQKQKIMARDIAKTAGVSPSTVSRVVHGDPHVKAATRARVLKVIEQKKKEASLHGEEFVNQNPNDINEALLARVLQEDREVTIYDIAEIAGVSAATVSRVLNDFPHVKASTRQRVLRVLEQSHFVLNEMARGLKAQSTRMIGILISDIRTTHHTDGIYYIQRELSQEGYSCIIYNTGVEEKEQARYIRLLSQRKVEGVVLMGSIYQSDAVRRALKNYMSQTPAIICNGYFEAPHVYGVIADDENGVFECVKLLFEKGRKNLAFLVDHYTPSNRLKVEGFLKGVSRFYEGIEPTVVETGTATEAVYAATQKLLEDQPEVDGIICSEDLLAVVGIQALVQKGISVPSDVAVIGINNSKYAVTSNPPLTSLDNMLYDLSLTAAHNLVTLLKHKRVNKKMMLCSEIVERSTT